MKSLPLYPETPKLAIELESARDTNSGCTLCKLGAPDKKSGAPPVRSVCMSAEVDGIGADKLLLVIGQGPGQQEDRHGRPNVGKSGVYLRQQLDRLWDGSVVYDNAVRCAPGTRKIQPGYVKSCRGYLAAVYREAKPSRILLLGGEACLSFIGQSYPTLSTRRGYTYTSDGVPVMILVHPAAALRNRFVRGWFEDDLEWAITVNPTPAPKNGIVYHVETVEDAQEMAAVVAFAGGFTFDLETFGHSFNAEHTILSCAVTPRCDAVAYVWGQQALDNPRVRQPLLDVLADPAIPKTGQNVKFDCVHIQAKYGVRVRGVECDTKLWRKLLVADASADLKSMQALVGMAGGKDEAEEYVDKGARELRKMVKKGRTTSDMFHVGPDKLAAAVSRLSAAVKVGAKLAKEPKVYAYAVLPPNVRARYNGTDTISTDSLQTLFEPQMSEFADRVWSGTVRDLNYAFTQMEVNGIAASRDAVNRLRIQMDLEIDQHRTALAQFGDVNVNSSNQVAELLFNKLGLRSQSRTATGKHSVGASVLEKLKHPAADAILGLRRSMKFKTQYADGMELFIRDDGRIHPTINVDGTETGRSSCEKPNLYNIPGIRTGRGKLCRDIYVAPEGKVLIEADYSQIELRVAAFLSGDPIMIDFFKRGVDFHLETAKLIAPIFGVDPATIDAEHVLRAHAKTANFAVLYDDDAAALAMQLGISRKMAEQLRAAILGKFKRLAAWIKERLTFSRKYGYTQTWWDGADYRRRPLWRIADQDDASRATAERSSWNTPAQGTGAEFVNATLGRAQKWIEDDMLPAKLVLTVYDSVIAEVDECAVDEYVGGIREIMEGWPSAGVPLKADFKMGGAWGSLESIK